ncbi:hypothetical protein AVEN_71964-1 [Araneus ventricosus]|uniref:Uncharacterized protein n=1 Tax=Araneus ventricosus TaxID=182803 RepID=A0A4Y2F6P1_ARAVE|nr:hypothetical protein AVEN_71964-1 [Araneus ventricosus]
MKKKTQADNNCTQTRRYLANTGEMITSEENQYPRGPTPVLKSKLPASFCPRIESFWITERADEKGERGGRTVVPEDECCLKNCFSLSRVEERKSYHEIGPVEETEWTSEKRQCPEMASERRKAIVSIDGQKLFLTVRFLESVLFLCRYIFGLKIP